LTIYDISGNIVRKIQIPDKSLGNTSRRQVGSWDLRDAKGKPVPEGTYLVRGTVKTADGKSEKVSLVLGVR
jgi:flagellar hook assembly protein FlgD